MRRGRRRANKTGRNEASPYVQLPWYLLESEAFLNLSPAATKTLLYVVKRFHGANNGRIAFGARGGCYVKRHDGICELSFGLSKSRVALALKELESAGFICCTKPSSFGQKQLVKEWRLTWIPTASESATKDFFKRR